MVSRRVFVGLLTAVVLHPAAAVEWKLPDEASCEQAADLARRTLREVQANPDSRDREFLTDMAAQDLALLGQAETIPRNGSTQNQSSGWYLSSGMYWLAQGRPEKAWSYYGKTTGEHAILLRALLSIDALRDKSTEEASKNPKLAADLNAAWARLRSSYALTYEWGPWLALALARAGDKSGSRAAFGELEEFFRHPHYFQDAEGEKEALRELCAWELWAGFEDHVEQLFPDDDLMRRRRWEWRLSQGDSEGAEALLKGQSAEHVVECYLNWEIIFTDSLQTAAPPGSKFLPAVFPVASRWISRLKTAGEREAALTKFAVDASEDGYPGKALEFVDTHLTGTRREIARLSCMEKGLSNSYVRLDAGEEQQKTWALELAPRRWNQLKSRVEAGTAKFPEVERVVKLRLLAGDSAEARRELWLFEKGLLSRTDGGGGILRTEPDYSEPNWPGDEYIRLAGLWRRAGNSARGQVWVKKALPHRSESTDELSGSLAKEGYWQAAVSELTGRVDGGNYDSLCILWSTRHPHHFPDWMQRMAPLYRVQAIRKWLCPWGLELPCRPSFLLTFERQRGNQGESSSP